MRKPSPRYDFATFSNVVVAISSTMVRNACTLSHKAIFALDEAKIVFEKVENEDALHNLAPN